MNDDNSDAADDDGPMHSEESPERHPDRDHKPVQRPLPQTLKDLGEDAIARMMKRPATPDVKVDGDMYAEGWRFSSPYAESDEDEWIALLFDAFGTRSQCTFRVFTSQLAALCSKDFDQHDKAWRPDQDELIAAIQIVKSLRPANEAQACLAAQMVAVHVATMKLAQQIGNMTYPDERTVATMARLARTYAMQMETMDRLKGKRRNTKQKITVVSERHVHNHQHVHLEGAGQPFGGQAHAAGGKTIVQDIGGAGEPPECTALPGPDTGEEPLPLSSRQKQAGVPNARRRKGNRGTEG